MIRSLALVILLALSGCACLSRQPATEAAAFIISRYVDSALYENVKQLYFEVEGAHAKEVFNAVSNVKKDVSIFSGAHEFEVRDGRFREKKSGIPCYLIRMVVEEATPRLASIHVSSTLSFGGIATTRYVLKYTRGTWAISEERLILISESKRPNKAPEPTPGLVTSRAEMASEMISSRKARLAPSPVVAHL